MATLALAGANPDARAQSTTDDREIQCSAALMSGLVGETSGKAWCSGYLGQYCSGEYASACNEGALARTRRGEADGAQENQSEAEEMERNRRLVEQLPGLPPESNPLIGRWRILPGAAPGALLTCLLIAGDGPYFEFRADALLHGARVRDSMRYYRGNEGVFFALGERYLRLLAFELNGRNRMTNGACNFERVGSASATPAPSPSQRQVKVWPPAAIHRALQLDPDALDALR